MNKNSSQTAFTLIELIVSLMLVSVIVLGIFSINMVLSNNGQDYGQRYLVRSETQTTLNHILNDVSLAVGSATYVGSPSVLNQGILIGSQMGAANNNSFCIHKQPNGSDTWVCYWLDTTPADSTYQEIQYCNKTYNLNDAAGYRGAGGSCQVGTTQFLGTAYSITNLPAGSTLTQSPYFVSSGGQLLFSIVIENCLNDSAASCYNSNSALQDPVNNPQVQVIGSAVPLQESI